MIGTSCVPVASFIAPIGPATTTTRWSPVFIPTGSLPMKRELYLSPPSWPATPRRKGPALQMPGRPYAKSDNGDEGTRSSLPQLLSTLFVCSAILGPFLDGYHGAFHVLEYKDPLVISLAGTKIVGTAAWVPGLFGVAGILIGGLYSLGDRYSNRSPTWPKVLAGISLFSFQYYLSGLLAATGTIEEAVITSVLLLLAAVQYLLFDRTKVGLIVGLLTAVGGPLIEVLIINTPPYLYHYTNPDLSVGIPSWIWAVYLAGAPAVGNLSRRLELDQEAEGGTSSR